MHDESLADGRSASRIRIYVIFETTKMHNTLDEQYSAHRVNQPFLAYIPGLEIFVHFDSEDETL